MCKRLILVPGRDFFSSECDEPKDCVRIVDLTGGGENLKKYCDYWKDDSAVKECRKTCGFCKLPLACIIRVVYSKIYHPFISPVGYGEATSNLVSLESIEKVDIDILFKARPP